MSVEQASYLPYTPPYIVSLSFEEVMAIGIQVHY